MKKAYQIEVNFFGYILKNVATNEKFVLYKSKLEGSKKAPYYLKEISPTETYISGMFVNEKKLLFNGKTQEGNKVIIQINEGTEIMQLN